MATLIADDGQRGGETLNRADYFAERLSRSHESKPLMEVMHSGKAVAVLTVPGGTNVMERTWWEALGGRGRQPIERLKALIDEGRVRRVIVEEGRCAVADFAMTASDKATACTVLGIVTRMVSTNPDCRIQVELADLEAAHVAEQLTTAP
jgi:hypothetical protein